MRISVLMPVHRSSPYLQVAIESILSQRYLDLELIIISNGEDAPCESAIFNISRNDERVRYFYTPIRGVAFALNLGLHQAVGELVARMDDDDVSDPFRFDVQVSALRLLELDAVGCDVRLINSESLEIGRSIYPKGKFLKFHSYFRNPFCHPTLLVKKDVLISLGGYCGFQHSEDYNLMLNLLFQYRFDNIPDMMLSYRVYESHSQRKRITYFEAASYQYLFFLQRKSLMACFASLLWVVKGYLRGKR